MWITSEIDIAVKSNHGDVIIEVARVKVRMNKNLSYIKFNMGVKFRVIVNIPFAQTNSESTEILKHIFFTRATGFL